MCTGISMNAWYNELITIVGEEHVFANEDMSRHTTFRAGGQAKYFVTPTSAEQVQALIELHTKHQQPFFVMGNGSNLLMTDKGYQGTIIQIGTALSELSIENNDSEEVIITAGAGALLSALANLAAKHSLTGLEFAAGIPGSIGGAVAMNAGAYGGEIKDVITRAKVVTTDGQIQWLALEELQLSYRNSIIQKQNYVVLQAEFALKHGDAEEITKKMEEFKQARKEKQPLEYPSAGSTFKRPEGHFAGKLIMDAGLRGYQVGGAQVSEKHCGFVINKGGATATDILTLMEDVSRIVEEQFGVALEAEVKIIGDR